MSLKMFDVLYTSVCLLPPPPLLCPVSPPPRHPCPLFDQLLAYIIRHFSSEGHLRQTVRWVFTGDLQSSLSLPLHVVDCGSVLWDLLKIIWLSFLAAFDQKSSLRHIMQGKPAACSLLPPPSALLLYLLLWLRSLQPIWELLPLLLDWAEAWPGPLLLLTSPEEQSCSRR